jgi:hypothetical protein
MNLFLVVFINIVVKVVIKIWYLSQRGLLSHPHKVFWSSVSQPPGRDPVPGPDINYTGPREVLLEVVILVF